MITEQSLDHSKMITESPSLCSNLFFKKKTLVIIFAYSFSENLII